MMRSVINIWMSIIRGLYSDFCGLKGYPFCSSYIFISWAHSLICQSVCHMVSKGTFDTHIILYGFHIILVRHHLILRLHVVCVQMHFQYAKRCKYNLPGLWCYKRTQKTHIKKICSRENCLNRLLKKIDIKDITQEL